MQHFLAFRPAQRRLLERDCHARQARHDARQHDREPARRWADGSAVKSRRPGSPAARQRALIQVEDAQERQSTGDAAKGQGAGSCQQLPEFAFSNLFASIEQDCWKKSENS